MRFTNNRNNLKREIDCMTLDPQVSVSSSSIISKRKFTKGKKLLDRNNAIHSTTYLIDDENILQNNQMSDPKDNVTSSNADRDFSSFKGKEQYLNVKGESDSEEYLKHVRKNLKPIHLTSHSDGDSKFTRDASNPTTDEISNLNLDSKSSSESDDTLLKVNDEKFKKQVLEKQKISSSNVAAGLAIAFTTLLLMKLLKR